MAEDIRNRTDLEQVKFAPHPAIPFQEVPYKYYHSAQSYMKFINKDGTEMQFRNHFLATNNSAHQQYLDEEIQRHGNTQVSYASREEVEQWKFKMDPKGTVTEQILEDPDALAELKWEIENKVRRENGLEELPRPVGMKVAAVDSNITDTDLQKIQGVDKKVGEKTIETPTGKITLEDIKNQHQAPAGPTPLKVGNTTGQPGAHTPNPAEKK